VDRNTSRPTIRTNARCECTRPEVHPYGTDRLHAFAPAKLRENAQRVEHFDHRRLHELASELAVEILMALEDAHRMPIRRELISEHEARRAGAYDHDWRDRHRAILARWFQLGRPGTPRGAASPQARLVPRLAMRVYANGSVSVSCRRPLRFGATALAIVAPSIAAAQPARHGAHVHDGFYFRGSLGFGTLAFDQKSDLAGIPSGRVSGLGTASDLMLGGTPAPGVVVGGALLATHAPNPNFDSNRPAIEPGVAASLAIIGPFVDVFFDPRRGFHLGAAAGPSAIWYRDLDPTPSTDREAYLGVGAAAWAGYDAWISANWSLGGYVRVLAATTRRQVDYSGSPLVDETAKGIGFAALFTALYH
jgi:hypothetical protein